MCPHVPTGIQMCPSVPTCAHRGPQGALGGNRGPDPKRQGHSRRTKPASVLRRLVGRYAPRAAAYGAPRGLAGAHGDPQNQEAAALRVFWPTMAATCSSHVPPEQPRGHPNVPMCAPCVPACAHGGPRVPACAHGGPQRALRGNRRPGSKRQDHPGPPHLGSAAVGWPVCPHVQLPGLPMGAYGAPRGLAGAHGAPQNQEIAALWVFWRTLLTTCSPLCPRNSCTGTRVCPHVPACARVCPRGPTGAHTEP
jgi:ferredoxin